MYTCWHRKRHEFEPRKWSRNARPSRSGPGPAQLARRRLKKKMNISRVRDWRLSTSYECNETPQIITVLYRFEGFKGGP